MDAFAHYEPIEVDEDALPEYDMEEGKFKLGS